jgi:septal ring factor EnvC (AmiA/AmiB activator)
MRGAVNIFIKFCVALAFTAGGWNLAYSQNTKAQEEKKARLEKEIEIIDQQLKANAKESSHALSNLSLIRKKVSSRKELLEESNQKINSYTAAIAQKEKDIAATQARLDTLSLYNGKLVRSAYKNRNAKIWYMYILASDDLGQAFRRYGYLRDLSKQLNLQAEKYKETKAQLEKDTEELNKMKAEAEVARAEHEAEMEKLQSEENQSRQVVNQLQRNKRTYQKQLAQKRREVEALNREIERIIREAMAAEEKKSGKQQGGSTKTAQPIDYKLSGAFQNNKGKLPWPADGPVVDHFGQHYHPVYTNVKLPFNNGISIALQPGTEIKAVYEGVVKQIIVMPGYNKCVLVQHGKYFTFYCKLGNVYVKSGDKVKTGQAIGTVDTIGGDTQLHFQIWEGRNPQNPETWLRPR